MFCDILDKKNAFLDYKNIKLKKSNNLDFSKDVSPWFFSENWQIFNLFLFATKKSEENAFYDILDIKKAFTEYKNINL